MLGREVGQEGSGREVGGGALSEPPCLWFLVNTHVLKNFHHVFLL